MTDGIALQARLEALQAALASGATSIGYEGKTISYKSSEEMRAALAQIESQINGNTGANNPGSFRVRSTKGW
jgi:hypothetical protein